MKDYNRTTTPDTGAALWHTFTIGFEHTIEGEGDDAKVVVTVDDDGQPVPVTYRVPARLTALDAIRATAAVDTDVLAAGGITAVVELVGAALGKDLILTIAADPTVTTDQFIELLGDLATHLHLDEVLPNPTTPPQGG
jgi:hypothetical protein